MPTHVRQSSEARRAKLDAAHHELVQALESFTTSEDWGRWLTAMSQFHRYSAANCLMILAQRPDATQVAGFHAWKALGRSVRKGARGIAIWAPVTRKLEVEDEEESTTVVRRVGFKLAYVFDVADTDGEPLPEHPGRPRLLSGQAPEGMVDVLVRQVDEAGYTLTFEPTVPGRPQANGVTSFLDRTVTVATEGRSEASQAKTLAHELAHVLLHADSVRSGIEGQRAEVEAESVAFLVCSAFGLDSMDYTLGYVAGWSEGDVAQVMATATAVQRCAAAILDQVEVGPTPAAAWSGAVVPPATVP